jgi:large subunit ribosomal protein L25
MVIEFKAQIRDIVGKKVKSLRKKGIIPAVLYGSSTKKPLSLEVNYKDFEKILKEAGESTVIKLKVGDGIKNVLIHDFAKDPVSDKFIHADFFEVRMDKLIKAKVPLVFEGEAPAVKILEGILIKNITELEVEALPANLPHEMKVDISVLNTFEDLIHIKDLKIPEGVKISAKPEEIIVSVMPPRSEEELKALEEKVEEKIEEVARAGEEEKAAAAAEETAEKKEDKKPEK